MQVIGRAFAPRINAMLSDIAKKIADTKERDDE